MLTETYNAIMAHADQFIATRGTVYGFQVMLYAWNDTADTVIAIARNAGLRVTKRIIGKGTPDAEIHLTIR